MSERLRETAANLMVQGMECDCCSAEMKALFAEWLSNRNDAKATKEIAEKLVPMVEACNCDICKKLAQMVKSSDFKQKLKSNLLMFEVLKGLKLGLLEIISSPRTRNKIE